MKNSFMIPVVFVLGSIYLLIYDLVNGTGQFALFLILAFSFLLIFGLVDGARTKRKRKNLKSKGEKP